MKRTAIKRTAFKAEPKPMKKRRSAPRRGRVRNAKYLDFIRTQPCLICRRLEAEAAHVGERGLGQKCDDQLAIPLCAEHHRTGRDAHHVLGKNFWTHHDLDRDEEIQKLQAKYEREKA